MSEKYEIGDEIVFEFDGMGIVGGIAHKAVDKIFSNGLIYHVKTEDGRFYFVDEIHIIGLKKDVTSEDKSPRIRLKEETLELAKKLNKLNIFMTKKDFYDLSRTNKDLLYEQSRVMNKYLQILGKRCELLEVDLGEEIEKGEHL